MYYYVARWYDPYLSRFLSPDSIIPDPGSSTAYDRYAYVNNNPLKYSDPSGHMRWEEQGGGWQTEYQKSMEIQEYILWELKNDYDQLDENLSPQLQQPTLVDKIQQGDISSYFQLLTPSHFGGRVQIEGSFDIIIGVSISAGANLVYNRYTDELVGNIDWAIEGGGGLGIGISGTAGILGGWGSSSIDDVTKGYSAIISGTAAAEGAGSVAVTVPLDKKGLHVDPYSGIVPPTVYVGLGAGGGYAGLGAGVNGPFGLTVDLTPILPWHWFK